MSISIGRSASASPGGFTLLEVILALAILGGALALLSEAVRIGYRNGEAARDVTMAELIAATVMDQMAAGILPPEAVAGVRFPAEPEWIYAVEVQPLDVQGLLWVRVTVMQDIPQQANPVSFALTRWLPDPGYQLPAEFLPETTEENEGSVNR